MPHLFPAPWGRFSSFIFKTETVTSFCVCAVLSTMRLRPLGMIMTINNHNSGLWCLQDLKLAFFQASHQTESHSPPLSICGFDLCSYCKRWGTPGKPTWAESVPVKPGGMGCSLICSHLVNKEPDLNTSSFSFRKLPQMMAGSNEEKPRRTEETVRDILHRNSAGHN